MAESAVCHRPSALCHDRRQRSAAHIIHSVLRPFRSTLPKVHPTAYIDQSAQVIGDVEIGEESSVWMNVVIRGDVNTIRIGDRTNIQDGTSFT